MSYKVKKGDTLSKIAKENNMSLNELLELNGISKDKANHISIGQEIKITKDPNSADFSQIGFKSPYPITMDWKSYHTEDKSMPAPFKEGYTENDYIKDNAETIQKQLKEAGYHLGSSGKNRDGVDGKWGKNSQAALDKALSEGYRFENGKLISPIKKNSVDSQFVPNGYNASLVKHLQGFDERSQPASADSFERSVTPRQYTAAQNTLADLIGAPLRRGISAIAGEEFTNKILPTRTFNENHLSPELYAWLQDAVDKKWSPEERIAYFASNPDGEVEKGWKGRIAGTKSTESDYKKYYSEDYTGPMKKGFKATMFGDGISQAQGTLGSFNLLYTKDGVYVTDDWNFGTGQQFDTSTLMGKVRQAEEDYGSQENSGINPTRSIKAFIRYRN